MESIVPKLIASFIFGGGLVALQAYAAEKVPKQVSGIVLALPSTIIVNYFFLGLVLTEDQFKQLLPVIPAPLGFSLIFITAYIYIAKYLYRLFFAKPENWWQAFKQVFVGRKLNKGQKIILIAMSSVLACAVWLLLSLPLAIYRFDNLKLSLLIFVVFALLNHKLIQRGCNKTKVVETIHYTAAQQIARACFAGLMVATTVYIGSQLGPFWGGVMAMFPAAFMASMSIIHYYYDYQDLFCFFKATPIGISTLVVYAAVAHFSFAAYGVWLGTLLAVLVSAIYSWVLSRTLKV